MNQTQLNRSDLVIEQLERLLSGHYEVERDINLHGQQIDLQARSKQKLQRYAFNKKLVIDESHLNDYLFFQVEPKALTKGLLHHRFEWLKNTAESIISSNVQHMRSRFIGILLSESDWLPNDIDQLAKRSYKTRWLRFGLHGWYEMMLICLHLQTGSIYSHRKGQDLSGLLEQAIKFANPILMEKEG